MAVEIDAMGKACPMPVVLAKQALDGGENDVTVVVDNQIAVENLMKMFLYTLAQSDTPPACLLFMNGGVKLPSGEEPQVIESLKSLLDKGCEILVCGTCLNYFGLTEQLKVGTVSNMYDIAGRLLTAPRVVTV